MPTSKTLRLFLLLLFPILLIGLAVVWMTEKGTTVLYFAAHRTAWANYLFRHLTYLGDGVMVGVVCLVATLVRFRYTLMLVAVGIGQLLVSAFFKRIVFGNTPRPLRYFAEQLEPAWLIKGVDVHTNYAFPSGHTITAFGLALFIALMVDNRWVTVSCVLLAAAIGFSRVYLFQHFLEDVLTGAVIGTANTALIFYAFANWRSFWRSGTLSASVLGRRGLGVGY
ncbi:phosphatase PAP2 family protein [Neolewinella lacunae]|uniref:Phosphatase PAP2 family protein n=1 Tax=Neolewinella lacunae TaxID=1517758 RepID=A0A923PKG5_9BACT|nr:phosphatase PAP2 family protein [Neolewinella lacunae]MBC6994341.1 phosphatase PAP2 family protein [Neolewinella lacunae]MDN3635812.1 phosphatase PAP2 family protein [Neolewinella lacunae]